MNERNNKKHREGTLPSRKHGALLSDEVDVSLTFIKFIRSLKKWQWGEANHYGNYYEWKYKKYRLLYDSRDDSFHVEPPDFDIRLNHHYVFDTTRWKAKTSKRIILNLIALPIIRQKAKEALLKELPARRKWQNFITYIKKTYPRAFRNFNEWLKMQACIYRGYGYFTLWLKDFMELAGIKFDIKNPSNKDIEVVFKKFEKQNAVVIPKIKEDYIKFARECPCQFTKKALETIS